MSLIEEFGLGEREMVSFVGAGGKTTLLLKLGWELFESGREVVLGTTTKMGLDQIPEWAPAVSPDSVTRLPAFVIGSVDGPKVVGSSPETFNGLFRTFDFVVVEADGARRQKIKAPAAHEPVIPTATTLVVVVASLDAVGRQLNEVAHRPGLVSSIVGLSGTDLITPDAMVELLTDARGGLARIPDNARVIVALTGTCESWNDEREIVSRVSDHSHVAGVVITRTSSAEEAKR